MNSKVKRAIDIGICSKHVYWISFISTDSSSEADWWDCNPLQAVGIPLFSDKFHPIINSSKFMKKKIGRNWLFYILDVWYNTQLCVCIHSFMLNFVRIYELSHETTIARISNTRKCFPSQRHIPDLQYMWHMHKFSKKST